jgi:hypothetical protein
MKQEQDADATCPLCRQAIHDVHFEAGHSYQCPCTDIGVHRFYVMLGADGLLHATLHPEDYKPASARL